MRRRSHQHHQSRKTKEGNSVSPPKKGLLTKHYVERKLAEEQTMQLLMMNHISDAEGQGDRIKKEEKKA